MAKIRIYCVRAIYPHPPTGLIRVLGPVLTFDERCFTLHRALLRCSSDKHITMGTWKVMQHPFAWRPPIETPQKHHLLGMFSHFPFTSHRKRHNKQYHDIIVIEHIDPTSLGQTTTTAPHALRDDRLARYAWQMFSGIAYLHYHKIVHRESPAASVRLGSHCRLLGRCSQPKTKGEALRAGKMARLTA